MMTAWMGSLTVGAEHGVGAELFWLIAFSVIGEAGLYLLLLLTLSCCLICVVRQTVLNFLVISTSACDRWGYPFVKIHKAIGCLI